MMAIASETAIVFCVYPVLCIVLNRRGACHEVSILFASKSEYFANGHVCGREDFVHCAGQRQASFVSRTLQAVKRF